MAEKRFARTVPARQKPGPNEAGDDTTGVDIHPDTCKRSHLHSRLSHQWTDPVHNGVEETTFSRRALKRKAQPARRFNRLAEFHGIPPSGNDLC